VRRPALLTALWALFAAAAVGVGFGAAGLVGGPFTDGTGDRLSAQVTRTSVAPGSTGATGAARSITTRGGVVSATCVAGLVALRASPAVGWSLDRIDEGRLEVASLELRRPGRDGKVEVSARCAAGVPRFALGDDTTRTGGSTPVTSSSGDDHGGSGGGSGDDGSGSGSSGGGSGHG